MSCRPKKWRSRQNYDITRFHNWANQWIILHDDTNANLLSLTTVIFHVCWINSVIISWRLSECYNSQWSLNWSADTQSGPRCRPPSPCTHHHPPPVIQKSHHCGLPHITHPPCAPPHKYHRAWRLNSKAPTSTYLYTFPVLCTSWFYLFSGAVLWWTGDFE